MWGDIMKSWMLLPLLLLAASLLQAGQNPDDKVLFEEKFAGSLDKEWTWVREEPGAWRLENGVLVLRTLPGYLHAKSNNSRNVLLRPLPRTDRPLAIEVYVESEPKVQFEHAGVVWYVDDDHYVSLFKEVLGGKTELLMVTEKTGKPSFAQVRTDAKGLWLRLVLADGKATAEYKTAGKGKWQPVGRSDLPSAAPGRVGVMTGGAPKDAERYARFRDFRIVALAKAK
jgi:regulation of enolase protein 1 (concanavalin A-like superfamily)